MTVGELLKRRRKELGLTQQALAIGAGCAVSMVCQIEQGKRSPSAYLAKKLAKPLKVKWTIFFDEATRNVDNAS